MVECPLCSSDIEYLNGFSQEETRYLVRLNKNGKEIAPRFDIHCDSDEYHWITFECPACMDEVADTEEKALAFLKGAN